MKKGCAIVALIAIIAGCAFIIYRKLSSETYWDTSPAPAGAPFLGTDDSNFPKAVRPLVSYEVLKVWDHPFEYPRTIDIDSRDNVYVSETYNGTSTKARILKFDGDGAYQGWFGKGTRTTGWHGPSSDESPLPGTGDGEFHYIFKIAFDRDDNMYVTDRAHYENGAWMPGNHRVQKFDREGRFLGWLGKSATGVGWHGPGSNEISLPGTEDGALDEPTCLHIRGDDLLVGSYAQQKIDKFDITTGALKEWFGKAADGSYGWHKPESGTPVPAPFFGIEAGAFQGPVDCMINSEGQFYIVSYNSDPVLAVFDYESGAFLWGLYHTRGGYKPQALMLDRYNNFMFSDNYEGSVRFFTQDAREVGKLQLGPGGDYFAVGDFAMDNKGFLYFVEQQKQKVYKVRLVYE